ncbi:MAG: ATP-binding protein [Desulfurococcaceae archaeon]
MRICSYLKKEKLPLVITIIGSMGSGKTTLSNIIHERCYPDFKKYCLEDVDELNNIVGETDKYYIVFDDFSYKVTGRRKEDQVKLNKIFRVRHILGTDNIVLVFVVHYLRSLAVFLRSSQVRILTSITEPEINMYSNDYLFTISTLWDYLHYFTTYKDRYIVLYHGIRSGEHILDVTITK